MPKVNPKILVWARETAGFSQEEAVKKLGLSGVERLKALELGKRVPSRRQLLQMSEKYRRPLLVFYMPEPPRESNKGKDFRTLTGGSEPGAEAILAALVRNVRARQELVRAALEETEEAEPVGFVGTAKIEQGVDTLVEAIQTELGFSSADFRAQRTVTEAFAALRAATEEAGVFVLLMGNLGTYHTDIDPSVFRGFALADDIAPFIVINEKDSQSAWSFTLLHELAHIFLGQTGVSGYDGEAAVEKFCDSVAARFLLDPEELMAIAPAEARNVQALADAVSDFASDRKLSRKMVAYNLLRLNDISGQVYRELSDFFDVDRLANEKVDKVRAGAPDYYTVRRHRVGTGLVSVVGRMVSEGALSTTKAGLVLGVKPTAVDRLIGGRRAA